jgi:hypothetical protein
MGVCVSMDIMCASGLPLGSRLGPSVSFGLRMRSLGFLGTCGFFFMLTT